jgi:hypothetical protein
MISEKRRKYNREYKRKQRGSTKTSPGPRIKIITKEDKEKQRIRYMKKANIYNQKIRLLALQYYSNASIPFCNCCGEEEIKFLSIDHIEGGGNKHRREIHGKSKGGNIGHWLRNNNYPEGFQVLCHNCNMAKGFYGECPHKDLT